MPAFYTHYYLGQEVLNTLASPLRKELLENKKYFDLGLQGPDIFFFYKPLKKNEIITYGNNLHHNSYISYINNVIDDVREANDAKLKAYLYGYTLHFIFDTIIHPTVNKYASTFNDHMKLEMQLDYYIIKKYHTKRPTIFSRSRFIKYDNDVAQHLKVMFPEISEEIIKSSIIGMKKYLRLLYSPSGFLTKILSLFLKRMSLKSDYSYLILSSDRYGQYNDLIKRIIKDEPNLISLGKKYLLTFDDYYNNDNELPSIYAQPFDHNGTLFETY